MSTGSLVEAGILAFWTCLGTLQLSFPASTFISTTSFTFAPYKRHARSWCWRHVCLFVTKQKYGRALIKHKQQSVGLSMTVLLHTNDTEYAVERETLPGQYNKCIEISSEFMNWIKFVQKCWCSVQLLDVPTRRTIMCINKWYIILFTRGSRRVVVCPEFV